MPEAASEVLGHYLSVANRFTDHVRGCPPDRWDSPSPCPGWSARDVVRHVLESHRRVIAEVSAHSSESIAADADLLPLWRDVSDAVKVVLTVPELSTTTVQFGGVDRPFEELVAGVICADTLIHTWDLARASGQDESLDSDAAERALRFLQGLGGAIRRPGGFGAVVSVPEAAPVQARLLGFAGRHV